jgi:hypothetical protein
VTMESSCTLELAPPALHEDVCVRLHFAGASVVPALVRLEHSPSAAGKFEALGEIRLQPKSLRQLRHMFRLGRRQVVQRVLRITCVGWLARDHAGKQAERPESECQRLAEGFGFAVYSPRAGVANGVGAGGWLGQGRGDGRNAARGLQLLQPAVFP